MPDADVLVDRRSAPRVPMVLGAEIVELPRGARLNARSADISRTGVYIDTLNPIPSGSRFACASRTAVRFLTSLPKSSTSALD